MAFLDLAFPRGIAAGVTGGPERRVDIVSLSSGEEERNARWRNSRRNYDASMGVRDADDLAEVIAFFEQTGGPLHSFRFRDWSDFSSVARRSDSPDGLDQAIGAGDAVQVDFQLVKSYGSLVPYVRQITKPVAGSVVVALDGVVQASGWSVDHLTGVVTFVSPPGDGVAVTAGFLFDVPVRFDTQRMDTEMAYFCEADGHGVGTVPQIPIIEVLE